MVVSASCLDRAVVGGGPDGNAHDVREVSEQEIPMRRKLIAAMSLLGVGGACALALVLGAQAPSADMKVDAFGCRLIIIDGVPHTVCSRL